MAFCGCLIAALLAQTPPALAAATTQRLDALLAEAAQASQLTPSPQADDATFVRRVWLDLAGRTPPVDAARKFLVNQQPEKRRELIESLLASQDAANHFGRTWTEYLTDKRPFEQGDHDGRQISKFLKGAWLTDRSYREVVRELIAGGGSSDASGPANFLLSYNVQPAALAGAVSKKFLGLTMHCAECHDHPHAEWKRQQFWGLAAHFARLRRMLPADEPEGDNYSLVVERGRGELRMPDVDATPDKDGNRPKKTVYPLLPGAQPQTAEVARRDALAAWITLDDNPYFARHFVNRTWARLFGRPLVASFEQPLSGDAASSVKAAVLDLLAKDFAASGFDLKQPLRVILNSQSYQRSSGPAAEGGQSESLSRELLARFPVRPLSADETVLAIGQATGYKGDFIDAGVSQLAGEDFGSDVATPAVTGQALSVPRSLALLNSDHVRSAAEMAASVTQRLFGNTPTAQHIEWLCLAAYSRPPRPDELRTLLKLAADNQEAAAGLADVAWVLLNSAEFNTNH